jgi:hypothetical protein
MPDEQIRIEQYRQAREDWRHYDTLIWATPTVVVSVAGGVLGLSFKFLGEGDDLLAIRASLFAATAFWIFTLLLALTKHRFFQKARGVFAQFIELGCVCPETQYTPLNKDETKAFLAFSGVQVGGQIYRVFQFWRWPCIQVLSRFTKDMCRCICEPEWWYNRVAYNWLWTAVFLMELLMMGVFGHTLYKILN